MQHIDTTSARERVGLTVLGADAVAAVSAIVAAEAAGVSQVWRIQGTPEVDTLTLYAAAAVQTSSIRLGTSLVPTNPRHPPALGQPASALEVFAPRALALG